MIGKIKKIEKIRDKAVGAAIAGTAVGIAAFHVIHRELYCKYRGVPGKSHCGVCGHRKVCKKIHHKDC